MRTASAHFPPYLLNQAGGISRVKEFSLAGDKLTLVPVDDKPMTGVYHLVYRCPDHEDYDIKHAVSSDGTIWSLSEPLNDVEEEGICYPGPCS